MDVVVSKFYSHFSVLYMFLLLLRISSNVLRLFPSKGRRLAPFSENFQKDQNLRNIRNWFFCAPCSSPCVLVNISLNSFAGTFFVRKKMFFVRMLPLIDGGCNLKEMMMIIVVNFVLDGISTSSCFSAPNRNLLLFFVVSPFPYWQPKINLTFSKFCYRTFALKVFYTNYK